MRTEEEVRRELATIHDLEYQIETRISDGLQDVVDNHGQALTEINIKARIKEMAAEFANTCKEKNPVLVTVREGASRFAGMFQEELIALQFRFQAASITTSSYQGVKSGVLSIHDVSEKLLYGDRPVYFVEDVIDFGHTYEGLKN